MTTLPTHAEWMKSTDGGPMNPRSAKLKQLDQAILGRNPTTIRNMLTAWQTEQGMAGKKWQESIRNKRGTVQGLHNFLHGGSAVVMRPDEQAALDYIKRSQQTALADQFKHCKLVLKEKEGGSSSRARQALGKLGEGALKLGVVGSKAMDILGNLREAFEKVANTVPGLGFEEVLTAIGLPAFAETAKTMVPWLGVAKSGKNALLGWSKVTVDTVGLVGTYQAGGAIRPGEAVAAMEAIKAILHSELRFTSAKASVASAAFGVKLAGAMHDLGTATTALVGAGETVATILLEFGEYVLQRKRFNAGNDLLAKGTVTTALFDACPLLGCYYAAIQPQSTIIDFDMNNVGEVGFQTQYERLAKEGAAVREQAFKLIQDSRYALKGDVEITVTVNKVQTQQVVEKTFTVTNDKMTLGKVVQGIGKVIEAGPENPIMLAETAAGAKEGIVGLVKYSRREKVVMQDTTGYGRGGAGRTAPRPALPPPGRPQATIPPGVLPRPTPPPRPPRP